MTIAGNVAIDASHLGTPFDITLPEPPYSSEKVLTSFHAYAKATKGSDSSPPVQVPPLVVVQLVHAGRQSMRGSGRAPWKPALAPSAVSMTPSSSLGFAGKVLDYILWGAPAAMTKEQISHLIEQFASAAELCSKAGFDGVELHASHGYQLAAFLSPRTNLRTDEYGQSGKGRARLLLEVVDAVRKRVPPDFIVGVKLNSCDYVQGGLTEDDALLNVQWLAESNSVDFVEISGGNYENAGESKCIVMRLAGVKLSELICPLQPS
jgi:2,4-dienoyl-CoA reductase-like NADH-dependent reductase (Old Yellow Enzyme family)